MAVLRSGRSLATAQQDTAPHKQGAPGVWWGQQRQAAAHLYALTSSPLWYTFRVG